MVICKIVRRVFFANKLLMMMTLLSEAQYILWQKFAKSTNMYDPKKIIGLKTENI